MPGQSNFAASVDAWVRETDQRLTAVFRESAQEVISTAQAAVPIDTGFLKSSVVVAVNQEPVPAARENPDPNGSFTYAESVVSLAIAGAEIGDVITASYSAVYARPIEYGSEGRAPRGFVRGAAAQWQAIVARVVARLKASVAASQR
jgi:sulfur carrier protein ThiS